MPSVPAKDLREFVALAKKQARAALLRLGGQRQRGHLAMEYLKLVTGMELQHVPYKGTGPNLVDLVAGRTHATSAGTPPLMPHVKAGKAARDRGRHAAAPADAAGRGHGRRAGLSGLRGDRSGMA